MSIPNVPPTATGAAPGVGEWIRKAAISINEAIRAVLGLENRVSDAEGSITALEADVSELDGDVTAIQFFLEPPIAIEAVELRCREVAADDGFNDDDFLLVGDATGAPIVLTLPALVQGRFLAAKKADASANAVTVQGGANIDGAASLVLGAQYDRAFFIGGSTEWHRL